jgi:NADPH:quinone reductase-like Zn-dependent oxidoreductase
MVGNRSLKDLRRALRPDGTLVMVGSSRFSANGREPRGFDRLFMGTLDRWLRAGLISLFSGQRLRPLIHKDSHDDLVTLRQMLEDGSIRPVIDRGYRVEEIAEALRYQDGSRAAGKVVITL